MAIIVEDGTNVAGANSYITEAELTTYAAVRGITITGTNSELLINAMDYLEGLDYIGTKQFETQSLQWPRNNVYIDGYYIIPTTIPNDLKKGQYETALSIDAGDDPLATIDRATKKEKLDVMEVEYKDNSSSKPIISAINTALRKILKSGAGSGVGGSQFKVMRG